MYEKDGEKYFIFDSHLHFWDACPANWVKGHEEYAKGWIECFHAYQGLGPAGDALDARELPEVLGRGLREGRLHRRRRRQGRLPVDVPEGVVHERLQRHRAERGAAGALPGQAASSTAAGTRARARPGSSSSRPTTRKYGIKGVKLYTAEWHEGSRGWKLTDEAAKPFLDKCVELGIKNIHVHKGPTIWPLDKDAFDVSDVDHVATDYNGQLNFIVEHVGLPRIEDFCFMATQEPNVYAGLAVVVGGLMHARPKFFAKVMGELLFWVGEDKMLFGSDYAHLGAEVADRGLRRLGDARRPRVRGLPAPGRRGQEEDPRPQRRQAVRRRGARGAAAAGAGRRAGAPRTARWASR